MKKRILFIISGLNKCGPVNQLYSLISSEAFDANFEVTVVSLNEISPNDTSSEFVAADRKSVV